MKIGYACTPLVVPWKTTRRFPLKNFSEDNFLSCCKDNLTDLLKILKYNISNNIYLFRISSDIIPFGSHEILTIPWWDVFKNELNEIGNFINSNSLRVSMHPGQYTVLNSPNEAVVKKAIMDLEYHNKFLNSLNIDFSHKIILHIGGVYDDKEGSSKNFINNFDKLSDTLKKRLIIENDERNYSLDDVVSISKACNIPVVYDNLHENCYFKNDISPNECLKKVSPSWLSNNNPIKVHYSQQDNNKKIGSHSPFLFTKEFINYLNNTSNYNFDIMLEVKDKDISAIKANNILKDFCTPISFDEKSFIFKCYSSLLISYSQDDFNSSKDILFNNSLVEFYSFIDELLIKSPKEDNVRTSLKNIYLPLEDKLTLKEVNHFHKLLKEDKLLKAKEYLHKCEVKYKEGPIYNFFYYY